jgi:uncharacterized protein
VSHAIVESFVLFGVGIAAGTINAVVGSGTLITFPTLLAFNYSPVLANVSNNIGLVPGVLSGVYGYRAELHGQRERLLALGTASLCGGLVGAVLLLVLPADAFKAIIPVLIGIALVMVVVQPRLARWVAGRQRAREARQADSGETSAGKASSRRDANSTGGPLLWLLVFCTGIYGGYFGAAQGVLLIGLLGIAFDEKLQRINAVKNVLAAVVNGVAAVVFIAVSHVAWGVVALIAAGSVLGGQIGSRIGLRLPPWALRLVIICVGAAALVKLLV